MNPTYDARKAIEPDDRPCETCNGSGEMAARTTYPMAIIGPGPVPEYAKGVCAVTCEDCGGTGEAP